jgi:hypothetical protein
LDASRLMVCEQYPQQLYLKSLSWKLLLYNDEAQFLKNVIDENKFDLSFKVYENFEEAYVDIKNKRQLLAKT